LFPSEKKKNNNCYDCGESLELFEMDMRKETKVMKCKGCGMYYFYKKELLSGWKILKITKDPSHLPI